MMESLTLKSGNDPELYTGDTLTPTLNQIKDLKSGLRRLLVGIEIPY